MGRRDRLLRLAGKSMLGSVSRSFGTTFVSDGYLVEHGEIIGRPIAVDD